VEGGIELDEDLEELRIILEKISKMRDELYSVAENRSLSHPDLVKASQEMDELLNRYRLLLAKGNS
jgi:hypothetical protein